MPNSEILTRILMNLFDTPCICPAPEDDILAEFERQHCFHPAIQPQLTADTLQLLCTNAKPYRIYVVQAALKIKLLLFLFNDQPVILGPFTEKEWNTSDARDLLIEQHLHDRYFLPYKNYYCRYRCLDLEDTISTTAKIIAALTPDVRQYQTQVLFAEKGADIVLPECEEPSDYDMVMERYNRENLLLRMVKQGNTEEALKAMQSMLPMASGLRYPVMKENEVAGINIVRTLLRKAAEEGGVHPIIVDAISQEYAQKTYYAHNIKELKNLSGKMIKDYCAAVKKTRQNSYIPSVRKAVTYIELNLRSIGSLEPVAKAAGISAGYLSHVFKSEVGCTIMQYIAAKRCEKAADLLENSHYSIQDIGNYVGYPDNNYFVKVFKSQYHMTPSQYRKQWY